MLSLLLSALLASNGSGKQLVRAQQGTTVSSGDASLLAYFPFLIPGCYPSGSAMGTKGETITVSRAGTRTCNVAAAGAAPQIVTCQANEACVEAGGLLVEPGRTNVALNTGSLCKAGNTADTSWTLNNATCANDSAADPSGSTSMDTVTTLNATGSANNGVRSVTSTTGPFTVSVWAAAVSGTSVQSVGGSCSAGTATASACSRSDGGACSYSQSAAEGFAYATVGTTPARLSVTFTCSVAVTSISSWVHDGQVFSTSGVGGRFWGIQSELGPYATSYTPTAGTSVARAADAISITNPLAATNPSSWCIDGTYTPESGHAWAVAGVAPVLAWTANDGVFQNEWTVQGSLNVGDSKPAAYAYDAAGAYRRAYLTDTHSFAAGSSHRIAASFAPLTPALSFDGSAQAVTVDGAGVDPSAQGASIYLGGVRGDGFASLAFGGYIRDFKVSKRTCR